MVEQHPTRWRGVIAQVLDVKGVPTQSEVPRMRIIYRARCALDGAMSAYALLSPSTSFAMNDVHGHSSVGLINHSHSQTYAGSILSTLATSTRVPRGTALILMSTDRRATTSGARE